ncbi:MAG: 16S rRNA (guanine(966)-N(2))-methyltransferase RsmD [Desulfovermiculus sp.]
MSVRIASGRYKGHKITTVSGPGYRPAMDKVRQALFSMLEARGLCWTNSRVLDLFAGSGSLGLEALSRGAQEVVFVDNSSKAVRALRETLSRLGVAGGQGRVVSKKAAAFLRQAPREPFDLAFVDPPYGYNLLLPTLQGLQAGEWIVGKGLVAAEVEADLEVPDVLDCAPEVNRTYGQTRIVVWRVQSPRSQSTQAPLTP